MECLLLPKRPARPIEKAPYVCNVRYDGGDWLSYPARIGVTRMVDDSSNPYNLPYQFVERSDPTPTKQQESIFQTWMFFGLIAEALDGNISDPEASLVASGMPVSRSQAQHSVLHSIYDNYITIENDAKYLITSRLMIDLEQSWAISAGRDREQLLSRCKRLCFCLWKVYAFLPTTSADFDPIIKCSISAVGEILAQLVHKVSDGNEICPTGWGRLFYSKHLNWAKEVMLPLGWCPSDLSRCGDKFQSLQILNFLSMLDKSDPNRGHENCNDMSCSAFSIDPAVYKVGHVEQRCSCRLVFIEGFRKNFRFYSALAKHGRFPLLRFIGDTSNFKVEIVEAKKDTRYVAISHVWADGLGNPNANALYRCQLVRLRSLVRALGSIPIDQSGPNSRSLPLSEPLIWIDTMCCPVSPRKEKEAALAKMRLVYENAACVLVLDAGLQLHESGSIDIVEKIARVITSGWLRRLWTLQEGALAKLLYFQFADKAISLPSLHREIKKESADLRHQLIYKDFLGVYDELRQFFHNQNQSGANLNVLSKALSHRGVSKPDDEAICIGTLMSLPAERILESSGVERTKVMWSLLMEKIKAIPSDVIFYEDERVDIPGWRWAPKSMLNLRAQLLKPEFRFIQFSDTQLAIQTPCGLQVQYPGFRLRSRQLDDARCRQTWLDEFKLPGGMIIFRDLVSDQWYFLAIRECLFGSKEQREAYDASSGSTLQDMVHDMAKSGDCLIISQEGISDQSSIHAPYTPYAPPGAETTYTIPVMGILASPVQDKTGSRQNGSSLTPLQQSVESALSVRTAMQVVVGPVDNVENAFYNAIEHCALKLRSDPITNKFLAIRNRNTEEWKSRLKDLKRRMEEMMANLWEENPALTTGLRSLFGDESIENLWVMILYWFSNGDIVGIRLPDNQIWLVD